MNEELKKLREGIASCQAKLQPKQSKADMDEDDQEKEFMKQMVNNIADYIFAIENQMYKMHQNHQIGHLPAIKSPGKMQKALKTLGVDDDYEVAKPLITIANTKQGMLIEANLPDKKDK